MFSVVMEQNIYHTLFYNLNPTFTPHHFHIFFISYSELLHPGASTQHISCGY